jgi:predicted DNA-binding WGR domain protein
MAKTGKTLEDFAGIQPTTKVELEIHEPSEGHSKFWRIYVYQVGSDYYVARHWGRNGSKGQQMVESFYSSYVARSFYDTLSGEKFRKGYRPEASPLDKIVREV